MLFLDYYGIIAAFLRGKGPRENAKRKTKEKENQMKYEMDSDTAEFIETAVDDLVAQRAKKAAAEIARLAAKPPMPNLLNDWLDEIEGILVQTRGAASRRETVIEALAETDDGEGAKK